MGTLIHELIRTTPVQADEATIARILDLLTKMNYEIEVLKAQVQRQGHKLARAANIADLFHHEGDD